MTCYMFTRVHLFKKYLLYASHYTHEGGTRKLQSSGEEWLNSHTDKWEPVMIQGVLGMCLGHRRAFQMSPGAGANRFTTRGGFNEDGPMGT